DGEELHLRRYNLECGVPYFVVMDGDEEYVGTVSTDKLENTTADGLEVKAFPAEECWPSNSYVKKRVDIDDKIMSLDYHIAPNRNCEIGNGFSYSHTISEQGLLNILGKAQSTTMKKVALHISSEDEISKNADYLYCECVIGFCYNQPVEVTEDDVKRYEKRFYGLPVREQSFLRDMYELRFPDDPTSEEDFVDRYHRFRNMQIEEMLEAYDLLADISSHHNKIEFKFDVFGKLKGISCETENNVFFEYLAEPEELSRINKGLNQVSYQELSDPEIFSIINRVQGEEINYLPDSPEAQVLTKAILGHDAKEITVNTKDMLKASFESVVNETDVDPMSLLLLR
ncbi:MAG: hypothetical protein KAI51_02425, partial [Candidatus Aenigmarchaeota archaeon]|nr:hypothetical protein [Candidatus Aenigmarchaeota archaeon]